MRRKQGKPIKVTSAVAALLDTLKRRDESYDSCLRRHFGLPTKKGASQSLREFFVVEDHRGSLMITSKKAEARGAAVLAQARAKTARSWPILAVREVPE